MSFGNRLEILLKLNKHLQKKILPDKSFFDKVNRRNPWFIPEFTSNALHHICSNYLNEDALNNFINENNIHTPNISYENHQVGILAAGNIPLVSFHDILCSYLLGYSIYIKPSSKDLILTKLICDFLKKETLKISRQQTLQLVRKLDRTYNKYLLTGSTNTTTLFQQYFSHKNTLIRDTKSSVCIIEGKENKRDFRGIADDIILYFGMGCKNITHLIVPKKYNFEALLNVIDEKYKSILTTHSLYMNNYNYHLASIIINKRKFFTNGSVILFENTNIKGGISTVTFSYSSTPTKKKKSILENRNDIQNITSKSLNNLGQSQYQKINTFADNKNTIKFLKNKTNNSSNNLTL